MSYLFVFGSYLFVRGQRGGWDSNGLSRILSLWYIQQPVCETNVSQLSGCCQTSGLCSDEGLRSSQRWLHHPYDASYESAAKSTETSFKITVKFQFHSFAKKKKSKNLYWQIFYFQCIQVLVHLEPFIILYRCNKNHVFYCYFYAKPTQNCYWEVGEKGCFLLSCPQIQI